MQEQIMNIRGKVVLVTGANRGLGKAFVTALLEGGAAKVYAAARDVSKLDAPGAVPVQLDITDVQSVNNAAAQCSDVEILINNAGFMGNGPLLAQGSIESLREQFEINTVGPLLMTRAFAPVLSKQGTSAIVNIVSVLSWLNAPGSGAYSASKAALWSISNGLRNELIGQNTSVMSVHPGFIDTDMTAGIEAPKISPAEVVKLTLDALAAGQKELTVDDTGRWVKSTLSNADAAYLSPL
jgi:NAD(P)-dependent dehydrogenase (short-subunit alcohol dehydrogenase family)